MPELPEAEIIRQRLRPDLIGRRIVRLRIIRDDIVPVGLASTQWYRGSQVREITRIGKCLVFQFIKPTGSRYVIAELGMTGLLLFQASLVRSPQHIHVTMDFENPNTPSLHYWNPRRFGRIYLLDQRQCDTFIRRRFGPDALQITPEQFTHLIRTARGRIKHFLMNQRNIAGIGNIYANEILYRARLHPHARGRRLSRTSLKRLYEACHQTLTDAIALGGSTIRDFRAPDGTSGHYQEHHAVYQKMGEPCSRGCSTVIRRIMKDRSTFYCPLCQKWK